VARHTASRPDAGAATAPEPFHVGNVNGFDVLDRVARLPVSTWRYDSEPAHVRHLGPMAQDFHAAFGLGDDDTTISAVDAHGVALVSIQALNRLVAELRVEVVGLRRELAEARAAAPGNRAVHGG
jgi:hypothetical protein